MRGVPLVLMSPFDWVRAPAKLLHAITTYRGTLCWLPNFAYNFCATRIRDRDLEGVDLRSLRAAINCSEPVYHSSHELFADRSRWPEFIVRGYYHARRSLALLDRARA